MCRLSTASPTPLRETPRKYFRGYRSCVLFAAVDYEKYCFRWVVRPRVRRKGDMLPQFPRMRGSVEKVWTY